MLPSPAAHNELADQPFEGLGKEKLRAIRIPIKPEGTQILLGSAVREDHLPGQPRICLSFGIGHQPGHEWKDENELFWYLKRCHLTSVLDELLPSMKYIFFQIPSYRYISPLHHQAAKSRQIIANENPGLHLIFHYDRIFIKPIPAYFLSASFWTFLRNADQKIYRAAIGFMRSYNYLIRYELDYDIACEKKLIPCDSEGQRDTDSKLLVQGLHVESYPTYAEFCRFIKQFDRVSNAGVSPRYHYGELRLQRLNLLAFLRKGRLGYFRLTRGWSVYIRSFLAPIILILGGASVILSAMQVNLNAQEMLKSSGEWLPLVKASLYFPVVIIILVTVVAGVIMLSALVVTLQDSLRARRLMRLGQGGYYLNRFPYCI